MARKMTPEELRAQAREMMKKAKLAQKDRDAKLGTAIREIAENGFGITYEELKTKVSEMIKTDGSEK